MATVIVDVETTGLGHKGRPPRPDAVVQVGMAWRAGKGKVKTWSSYCNPGKEFLEGGRAEQALRVNGIREETILNAEPIGKVAGAFWRQVGKIESKTCSSVEFRAYNRSFDEGFLSTTPWEIPPHRWSACIMLDATDCLNRAKWLRLEEAMQALRIPWPEDRAHDAAVDAHAALLVHEKLRGF